MDLENPLGLALIVGTKNMNSASMLLRLKLFLLEE
jgi:hypothetical protein